MNPQPKQKAQRSQQYCDWLKNQRCVLCGRFKDEYRDIVPAHQNLGYGMMGGKASDTCALPLCTACHAVEHWKGNATVWNGINKERLIIEHLSRFIGENL